MGDFASISGASKVLHHPLQPSDKSCNFVLLFRKSTEKQSATIPGGQRVRASKHTVFPLRRRPFGVFSKLGGIVHCGLILVTLLGKASRGLALRARFKCLALVWSFVAPLALLPACLRGPSGSAGAGLGPSWGPGPDLSSFTPNLSGTHQ